MAHFKIAGVMINQEVKPFQLLDHVKTEVSYLLLQIAVLLSGPHHPQGMGSPWWKEEGVRWSQVANGTGWLHKHMRGKLVGHYRANVLLRLLDTFHFWQVRDWGSLSNCFLILHLQI